MSIPTCHVHPNQAGYTQDFAGPQLEVKAYDHTAGEAPGAERHRALRGVLAWVDLALSATLHPSDQFALASAVRRDGLDVPAIA